MQKHIEHFIVESEEVNQHNEMKIPILQKKIQDVSDNHGAILGFGFTDMSDIGLFWVVSRLMVEIKRLPKLQEEFRIETWLDHPGKAGIDRFYRLMVGSEEIVTGIAKWALVSRETLSVERMDKYAFITNLSYLDEALSFSYPVLKKIQRRNMDDLTKIFDFTVTHSMLDHNQHVNNTEYIKAVIDRCAFQGRIKMYEVSYIKPMYASDDIRLYQFDEDESVVVEGYILKKDGSRILSFQALLQS